ncbi:toxin-activating lysine-acyltransferase [Saccharospirillum impatiens]|uniref:toxin-activating lysine-acyltransferase n=1 Tax=Saccharospirillum impatiens TaxID=169438 RepID=UPI0003FBBF1B|nr:toxin-activating lysine-acyltransferase [Saccharospirillum impatiens]
MKLNINSPLAPCVPPDSGQLTPYQAIGLVTDLAMNHGDYCDSSVKALLDRLIPALNTGNAKVFFDDASRPYGYASWATVPDDVHHSLLAGTGQSNVDAAQFFSTTPSGNYLWFFDLLCPFTSPLAMYRTLKQSLTSHDSAYLVPATQLCAVRRIW